MFISPQISYAEILTLKVMVLGGEAFESLLGHEGGALIHGISALIKEALVSILLLSPLHHKRTQKKAPSMRKWALTRHQILGL